MDVYLSPVETYCTNIDYYIPDEDNLTKTFSEELMARLRKLLQGRIFPHESIDCATPQKFDFLLSAF